MPRPFPIGEISSAEFPLRGAEFYLRNFLRRECALRKIVGSGKIYIGGAENVKSVQSQAMER